MLRATSAERLGWNVVAQLGEHGFDSRQAAGAYVALDRDLQQASRLPRRALAALMQLKIGSAGKADVLRVWAAP